MRRALDNALRGWGQTAPNPMVGAVIVRDDEIIADGWHARFGGPHAEVAALAAAGDRARGATMFVTLEPCTHHGKTPPCVDAIIAAGIARVVIAARDPNPVAGGGLEKLKAAGIDVETGVLESEAREQNAAFFHSFVSDRPWVTLKIAATEDWAIADPTGRRRWITGAESRAEVHRMRANVDGIVVGVGTVIADDPELTVRDAPAPRVPPMRIVFDRSLRIPRTSKLVVTAREVPTTVVTSATDAAAIAELSAAGVRVLQASSLSEGLRGLRSLGIRSVLVEAGPRLTRAFWDDHLIDRLVLFMAPGSLGDEAPKAGIPDGFEMPIVRQTQFGPDLMVVGAFTRL
jgi:diaminohydroxyphosphoribosylaminopyrimidine deaminase/5-amino-6-(5-phosphoribosylamino)uracil reductase